MSKKKELSEHDPRIPPPVQTHRVTQREWDDTMRAALAGLIASSERVGNGSYVAVIVQARIYAQTAHGERPKT